MLKFLGRRFPEIAALSATALVMLIGVHLAWTQNPIWLNRTGAVVIVIGVLLAASRFHEWIQRKVMESFDSEYETLSARVLATIDGASDLTAQQRTDLRSTLRVEMEKDLEAMLEPDKRRVRLWEVYLVCTGTLLNGFGDYLIQLLKGNGT